MQEEFKKSILAYMIDKSGQDDIIGPHVDKESRSREATTKEKASSAALKRIT